MEKAFLIGVKQKSSGISQLQSLHSLEELARLVETAGGTVVGQAVQAQEKHYPASLIGSGKVEELAARAKRKEFNVLVFDEELKPNQHKYLTEKISAKILDRTRLILDIFARRAHTKEGILQVELAQLSYLLPRITERYGTFEQQVGGIGTRGPGERKLEVETRHIQERMMNLRRRIERVKLHRKVLRQKRDDMPYPVIALVGYTNAGKSTLLNALVDTYGISSDKVYADDKLFATLDPVTRRIRLPSSKWALFTDTVGFIQKLPTHLVAAFRATLEEAVHADVLLLLLDAGDPESVQHLKTVQDILESLRSESALGDLSQKTVIVLNKIDSVDASAVRQIEITLARTEKNQSIEIVAISAARKKGLRRLLQSVERRIAETLHRSQLFIPYDQGELLSWIYRLGQVHKVEHRSGGTLVECDIAPAHEQKLRALLDSNQEEESR